MIPFGEQVCNIAMIINTPILMVIKSFGYITPKKNGNPHPADSRIRVKRSM